MTKRIAIDFGTMRTKLSYLDERQGKVELMRLGQNEKVYIPSLFCLREDGVHLYGEEAEEILDSEPLGFLPQPLKRILREQWVRAGNRVKSTPTELLSMMFKGLRKRTGEIPQFMGNLPEGLTLTVPAQYGQPDRTVLKTAAKEAGFSEDLIEFVDEPVAAANAWLDSLGGTDEIVVVLDCGGGTLDWACLQRKGGGNFELIPDLPPNGDNKIGGVDIDEALCVFVDDSIDDEELRNELGLRRCYLKEQIRILKEKYSKTGSGGAVRIGGKNVEVPADIIADAIQRRFISQACQAFGAYISKVKERLKIDNPKVLLVGGSSKLRGLKEAIESECHCMPVWWERSEYATILGGISQKLPVQTVEVVKKSKSSKDISIKDKTKPELSVKIISTFTSWLALLFSDNQDIVAIKEKILALREDNTDLKNSKMSSYIQEILDLAQNENPQAAYIYGLYCKLAERPEDSKKWFKEALRGFNKSIEQGNINGQAWIGSMYSDGDGVEQDNEEAVKWYRKAAEQGDIEGQVCLGAKYIVGDGVEQDYAKAFKWFRNAAEQGSAYGQYWIGIMYRDGTGVEQDYEEALNWFKKAAGQGNADGQYALGTMYRDGIGINEDYKMAIKLFNKVADQDDADGQVALGTMYLCGKGVRKNYEKALNLYRKAAEQGNADGQYCLGVMHRDGAGLKQDFKEAVKWFQKAAEQGDANGQRALGGMYSVGEGFELKYTGEKLKKEAIKWFRKAAKQGDETARKALEAMENVSRDLEQKSELLCPDDIFVNAEAPMLDVQVKTGTGVKSWVRDEGEKKSPLVAMDQVAIEKANKVSYGWYINFGIVADDIIIENKSPFQLTNVKVVFELISPDNQYYPKFAVYANCISPGKPFILESALSVARGTNGRVALICDQNLCLFYSHSKCPFCMGALKGDGLKCNQCIVSWHESNISEKNNPQYFRLDGNDFLEGFKKGWNSK